MLKILIVEDETLVSKMLVRISKESGFEAEVAGNGEIAINKVKDWKPDIIILDIMMPVMNGFEALEKFKSDPESKDIPVIMLTNMSGKYDRELALSKGATAFWIKEDFNPKLFKKNVLSILEK